MNPIINMKKTNNLFDIKLLQKKTKQNTYTVKSIKIEQNKNVTNEIIEWRIQIHKGNKKGGSEIDLQQSYFDIFIHIWLYIVYANE